jgi:predicted transcriptional regulator
MVMAMNNVAIRVDEEIMDWLKEKARERHAPMSTIVRDAIVDAMEKANREKATADE